MAEIMNACKTLVGNLVGNLYLGKGKCIWRANLKIDILKQVVNIRV